MEGTTTLKVAGADYVITVDAKRRVLRNASIVIENDRITRIGSAAELADVDADRVIDGAGMLVTPGLINTHEHLYGHVMRGMNSDVIDVSYIANACAVRAAMTEEEEYVTTLASVTEFLTYGTTTFVNPGDSTQVGAAVRAYEEAGCRAIIGRNVTDRPNAVSIDVAPTTAEAMRRLEAVLDEYAGRADGRVVPWVMLAYGTGFSSDELVVQAKQLADDRGTGMTIHQSPRQSQVDDALRDHGVRPLVHLDNLGVMAPNLLLGHAIRVDDEEIAVMARTGTAASMSPVTSLRLGFGTTHHGRLPEMLAAGVTVGLGTDTTDFAVADMLKSAQLAATIYKDAREDTSMVSGEQALEMITIGGAKACGLEHEIGSLEVGKKADLVLFDTSRPEWQPLLNPVQSLIYYADGRSVDTVVVDGRILVEGGTPTFADRAEIGARLQSSAESLVERTGITVAPRWPTLG